MMDLPSAIGRLFRDIDWQAGYDSMEKSAFVFDRRMLLDAQKLRESA